MHILINGPFSNNNLISVYDYLPRYTLSLLVTITKSFHDMEASVTQFHYCHLKTGLRTQNLILPQTSLLRFGEKQTNYLLNDLF